MHTPRHFHLIAVQCIIRYLKGTPRKGIFFPNGNKLTLSAFADADDDLQLVGVSILVAH